MIYLTNVIYVDMSSNTGGAIDKVTAENGSIPSSENESVSAPTRMHWGASLVDNGCVTINPGYRTKRLPEWSG